MYLSEPGCVGVPSAGIPGVWHRPVECQALTTGTGDVRTASYRDSTESQPSAAESVKRPQAALGKPTAAERSRVHFIKSIYIIQNAVIL